MWSAIALASSGGESACRLRCGLAAKRRRNEAPRRGQRAEIDAGADPEPVEHEQHVLARDIAGSAWREGAATEPSDRAVDHAHAFFECHQNIRHPLPVGIVEMYGKP